MESQDMVDSAIFEGSRGVVEALVAHDCQPALAWCAVNELRLKKIRSSLEFQLRVQVTFICKASKFAYMFGCCHGPDRCCSSPATFCTPSYTLLQMYVQ